MAAQSFTIQNNGPTTVTKLVFTFDHPTYGTPTVDFSNIKAGEPSAWSGTTYTIDGLTTELTYLNSRAFTVDYSYASGTVGNTDNGSITVTAYNSSDNTDTEIITTTVNVISGGGGGVTITISPSSLPSVQEETAYNETISASGGTSPYTFATSDSLPNGITLGSDGVLSGTPALGSAGTYSFTVTATDSATPANTQNKTYSLTVSAFPIPAAPVINSFTFDDMSESKISVAYDNPNFRWNITAVGGAALEIDTITLTRVVGGVDVQGPISVLTGGNTGMNGAGTVHSASPSDEVFGEVTETSTFRLDVINAGGSASATVNLTITPSVNIAQFSLVPSVADHNEAVEIAFQTTLADRVWIRKVVTGGADVDIYGTSGSYASVTPGQLYTNIAAGTADYYTTGGSVLYRMTARLSTNLANTLTEERTLTINTPTGLFMVDTATTGNVGTPFSYTVVSTIQNEPFYITFDTGSGTGDGTAYISGALSGTCNLVNEIDVDWKGVGNITPLQTGSGYLRFRTSSDSSSGANIGASSPITFI